MATTDFTNGVSLTDAAWFDDVDCVGYSVLSGVAGTNTITATGPATYTYSATRPPVWFIPAVTNTAATTINVTPSGGVALGARNIFSGGAACVGGELVAGVPACLIDDGTRYHILGAVENRFLLSSAVGANALTLTLAAGSSVTFRSATASTGTPTPFTLTSALTLTISSGSTLGAVSATAFRVWIVVFNDAGTLRLGAINCLSTAAGGGAGRDVTAIFPLAAWGIASSTAEGGAGAADSAQVFYTGSAVVSKAYAVVGYATWETGLTTAGTWDAVPTRLDPFKPDTPLPGRVVQIQPLNTGAVATGTTTVPYDDTIPQSGEGDQYMSQAITPSSAANVLGVKALVMLSTNVAIGNVQTSALFQDATANALKASHMTSLGVSNPFFMELAHMQLAATTSATTFKVRSGNQAANTTTFNGNGASREYGGVMNSFLGVEEVMA